MRRAAILGALLLSLAQFGCATGSSSEELTVSAAASLADALEDYGASRAGEERYSFGGSDELAAQIRQGARPDLFASASPTYVEQLHREGLVSEPVVFARNRLVVAVPPGGEITRLRDLGRPGVDVLIGARGLPAGDYARAALAGLPASEGEAILANVRSEEPDVKGIVGKVAQGAADAGFVYASDVAATAESLVAIELPEAIEPDVEYTIAVVADAANPTAARDFIEGLLVGPGAAALDEAGFLPPRGR